MQFVSYDFYSKSNLPPQNKVAPLSKTKRSCNLLERRVIFHPFCNCYLGKKSFTFYSSHHINTYEKSAKLLLLNPLRTVSEMYVY